MINQFQELDFREQLMYQEHLMQVRVTLDQNRQQHLQARVQENAPAEIHVEVEDEAPTDGHRCCDNVNEASHHNGND